MQTHELDQGDLVLTWTWAERMELLGQIENIKQQMEQSFSKYFTNDKSRLEADSDGRKE